MGRRRSVPGGRVVVWTVRLSERQSGQAEALLGGLSRSEWLRWVIERAIEEGQTPTRRT